ncbi:MAG: cyclophilin-like fold protein [Stenotrophomonas sp.]
MSWNHPRTISESSKEKRLLVLGLSLSLSIVGGCKVSQPEESVVQDLARTSTKQEEDRMWMTVGERRFAISLADNETARVFASQFPLKLEMTELNGNEKHGDLPRSLPTNASRPGTIRNGDLMLYGSNTVVVFYKTFRSSYSYTPLARVDDPDNLSQVLGQGSVQVAFSQ